MGKRSKLQPFVREQRGWHKGFYIDANPDEQLQEIKYTDYFKEPHDADFMYDDARLLLHGSCHLFALSLSKLLGYSSYLIEGKDGGFHAFCQVRRYYQLFYVDARGVTTSVDEFMEVAGKFADGEFSIREITPQDIQEWEDNEDYYKEALAFAEAVIKEYEECYRV